MSKLLINEHPVMIIPSLALKLGLNEAVILQQIHYWLTTSSHVMDGRKWVYNTYKEWQMQLPFWSESTIKRTIKSLEKQGYILSANFNHSKMDQTKWYSIHYEKLAELDDAREDKLEQTPTQMEQINTSECHEQETSLASPIPETTTETSSEKEMIPYSEVIQYLNNQTGASYKPTTRKTRELIQSRFKEGFTLADFKRVIDLKTRI